MAKNFNVFFYVWLLLGKLWGIFFIFAGSGFLGLTLMPLLLLFPGNARHRAQSVLHHLLRFYIHMLHATGAIHFHIEGADILKNCRGNIIIANHPSLLDVVILIAYVPRIQCIVKHELWHHPLLRRMIRCMNYIRNDLEPEDLIAACKSALDDGDCLIIFPEGTRTRPGLLPRFQRGFANIATITKAPIQPVIISVTPPFLYKGEPWWHVPVRRAHFNVRVGDCLDAETYLRYGRRSRAARNLVELLEIYYAKQFT